MVSISILFPLSEITNLSVRKCNGHTNDTCAKRLHTYTKILKVGEQHLQHSMQLHIHHSLVVKAISQQQSCSIEDKHFQVIAILSHCNILIPIYRKETSMPCLTSIIDRLKGFFLINDLFALCSKCQKVSDESAQKICLAKNE